MYSLGVVLYEMLYGVVPFEDYNIPGLLNKIKEWKIVFHQFNKISPSTEYLIKRLLEINTSKRMDWDELFDFFSLNDENNNGASGSKTPGASSSYKSTGVGAFSTAAGGSTTPQNLTSTPTSNRLSSKSPVL
mmetsp:Transcript_5618/g.4763  ORF Transcript_5618/g.4763 Transcript_5618/m.4763 type:complete len:132 (+) Transcript_5618:495-890(+)